MERILLLLDPLAGARKASAWCATSRRPAAAAGGCRPAVARGGKPGLQRHQVQPGGNRGDRFDGSATRPRSRSRWRIAGYGIPAADQARIFEKFYRVPRVQDADVPGTGLGLALVREIAELHGGSVTVKSEVGAGSTFTLRIPRVEDACTG